MIWSDQLDETFLIERPTLWLVRTPGLIHQLTLLFGQGALKPEIFAQTKIHHRFGLLDPFSILGRGAVIQSFDATREAPSYPMMYLPSTNRREIPSLSYFALSSFVTLLSGGNEVMLVDEVRLGRRYIPVSSRSFYEVMRWVINHSAYMSTQAPESMAKGIAWVYKLYVNEIWLICLEQNAAHFWVETI